MKNFGTEVTERDHAEVINTYLRTGQLSGADAYLSALCGDGTPTGLPAPSMSIYLFNLVIRECGRLGQLERANYWLNRLQDLGLKPNVHSFGSLINTCAESNNMRGLSYYTETMERLGLARNDVTYNTLIKACGHSGNVDRAQELLDEMLMSGVEVSSVTYNSIIRTCTRSGKIGKAEEYLDSMEKNGVNANIITYNSVINACAAQGDVERMDYWLQRLVERGMQPSLITYGTICKAFAKHGLVDRIGEVMNQLEAFGMKLNEYFYASLILACGKANPQRTHRVDQVVAEMLSKGLSPQAVRRPLVQVLGKQRATELLKAVSTTGGILTDVVSIDGLDVERARSTKNVGAAGSRGTILPRKVQEQTVHENHCGARDKAQPQDHLRPQLHVQRGANSLLQSSLLADDKMRPPPGLEHMRPQGFRELLEQTARKFKWIHEGNAPTESVPQETVDYPCLLLDRRARRNWY